MAVTLQGDDLRLASEMTAYWTTFAHRGTPNAEPATQTVWAPYDPARDNVLLLGPEDCREIEDFGETHHCSLSHDVSTEAAEGAG